MNKRTITAATPLSLRVLALSAIGLALAFVSGCAPSRNSAAKATESVEVRTTGHIHTTLNLDDSSIAKWQFEVPVTVGPVDVYYTKELKEAACGLANKMSSVYSAVEERTGLALRFGLRFYLIASPEPPQYYDFSFVRDDRTITLPVFAVPEAKTADEVLASNVLVQFYAFHELAESALVDPQDGPAVPSAKTFPILPLPGQRKMGFIRYYADRWFREGLANYAGYVALDASGADPSAMSWLDMPDCFTALSDLGVGLFKWTQAPYYNGKGQYYRASLGLFMLIKSRYGDEAIRRIVEDSRKRDRLTPDVLIDVCNKVLGADIEKMAKDFRVPRLGISMRTPFPIAMGLMPPLPPGAVIDSVTPGSLAAEAGLVAGDAVSEVDGTPIRDYAQLAMAIVKAMDRGEATVVVTRADSKRTLTLKLPPAGPQRPSRGDSGQAGGSFLTMDFGVAVDWWTSNDAPSKQ